MGNEGRSGGPQGSKSTRSSEEPSSRRHREGQPDTRRRTRPPCRSAARRSRGGVHGLRAVGARTKVRVDREGTLNTGLLGDPIVSTVMKSALGFTLEDIRSAREASAALLNHRFFGARDRVGEIVQSGTGTDDINADAFRRDINLMLNECRLFGAVSAVDAAKGAGIEEPTAKAVLAFFSTSRPAIGQA